MAKKLTSTKARKILHDKEVHGHPLTEQQRKFFGAIAGGAEPYKAQIGTMLTSLPSNMMDRLSDALAFPQKAITQLFTGKYQTPSEAMNIQSPAGAIAADLLLDPVNLVSGAGFAKGAKAAKAAPKVTKFSKFQEQNPLLTKLLKEERPSWFVKPSPKNAKTDALEKKAAEKYLKSFVDSPDEKLLYETVNPKLVAKVPNYKGIGLNPHLEGGRKARKFPEGSGLFINPADKLEKGYNIYDLLHDTQYHLRKNKNGGWLDKYDAPQAQNGIEGTMGGLTDVGFNYNGAWGGTMQMGGSLPGAVGFTYARTAGAAPANGPYAKKTKASAQNGQEMKYYQQGLDFTPKTISQNGSRTPIYVSDPNDPRLKTYQDSLYNYNVGRRLAGILDADENLIKVKPGSPYDKALQAGLKASDHNLRDNTKEATGGYKNYERVASVMREYHKKGNRGILPIRFQGYFPDPDNTAIDLVTGRAALNLLGITSSRPPGAAHLPQWKKPEQQVILDPSKAPKKQTSKTIGPFPIIETPRRGKYVPIEKEEIDLGYELPTPKSFVAPKAPEQTPTKYTFTYPTGKYNEQKTMYFPSKSALKSFVGGIRDATYQEGKDYASATGTLQDGGYIPVDPMGYWNPENVGNPVIIPSNIITMEGVDQPLLGISDTGDVQYMMPGEDYEFDGEYVTEYPVAQGGKRVPITVSDPNDPRLKAYQDSLALYNRSNQARVDALLRQGFKYDTKNNKKQNYLYTEKEKRDYQKSIGVNPKKGLQKMVQSGNDGRIDDSVGGEYDRKAQYELVHGKIAPIGIAPLYDSWWRTSPTLTLENDRPNPNYGKPFAKDFEGKVIRNFFSVPLYKEPVQPVEYRKPEPKQEVVKKPEPVVEKKAPLTDYFQGTPIYAPTPYHGSGAGAFVGYRTPQGDTVFVKPEDYERMGVPKYGREFIESKTKKMKNGGVSVNNADAQPLKKLDQLLNFTNYNKPTKGGWLDKYN